MNVIYQYENKYFKTILTKSQDWYVAYESIVH